MGKTFAQQATLNIDGKIWKCHQGKVGECARGITKLHTLRGVLVDVTTLSLSVASVLYWAPNEALKVWRIYEYKKESFPMSPPRLITEKNNNNVVMRLKDTFRKL